MMPLSNYLQEVDCDLAEANSNSPVLKLSSNREMVANSSQPILHLHIAATETAISRMARRSIIGRNCTNREVNKVEEYH
jgi:hypothetical protein